MRRRASSNFSFSRIANKVKVLDAATYASYINEQDLNSYQYDGKPYAQLSYPGMWSYPSLPNGTLDYENGKYLPSPKDYRNPGYYTDEYGNQSLENRCRYPLEVLNALRAVWPADKPLSVRISAHDWLPDGNTADDAIAIARLFKAAGADLIDVSSGQTTRDSRPVYGRMYQTPFADRIRNEAGIATMAVGAISEADHANSIIAAGRADLCAVARPHLANPAWTLTEAAKIGYTPIVWPKQYFQGKRQMEANFEREKAQQQAAVAAAAAHASAGQA